MSISMDLTNKKQNVFICYKDQNKMMNYLAVENGNFFMLKGQILKPLNNEQVLSVLIGISTKKFKVVGFGRFSKKLVPTGKVVEAI